MSRVIGAAFYAMATRYISLLIQLASVMAVSRLLTPEEIGIYSIAASIFGLALLIRDFGIGSYLIQEKNVDRELAASAFSMSLLLCWPLALIVYFSGDYVADFYEVNGIADVFNLLSINLVLIPFGSITLSFLKREMKFNKVMTIDIGSSLTSALVTIICALKDVGFMSLAYGSVAGTVATVILASVHRPKWLPYLPGIKRVKEILSFGWRIGGSNVFFQINSSSSDLIIGKMQGVESAAFLNKAESVFKLFNQLFQNSLRTLFQVYIAKSNRDDGNVAGKVYKINSLYLIVAWPFSAFTFFQAETIVFILFGTQWDRIIPLVQLMCINHFFGSVLVFHHTTLLGLGESKRILRMSGVVCLIKVFVLLAFGYIDLEILVLALLLVLFVKLIITWDDMKELLDVELFDFLKELMVPLFVFIVVFVFNLFVRVVLTGFLGSTIQFILMLVGDLVIVVFMAIALDHPFKYLLVDILLVIKNKINSEKFG